MSTKPASAFTAETRKIAEGLPGILQRHPVSIAYLYGSAVSGKTTLLSDIDIALVLEPDCSLDPYGRFMLELEVEAEIDRLLSIHNADVRCIDTAPLRVQGHVLSEGKRLYVRDDGFRVSYETRTRKLYFDFQPVLTMMRQARVARRKADLKRKGFDA